MKKASFLCLLVLLAHGVSAAAQNLTLDEFRTKLKGIYYDPQKDGMKGFQCEVKTAILDKAFKGGLEGDLAKGLLGTKFTVVYDLKEIKLYPTHFTPTQATNNDPALMKLSQLLSGIRDMVDMELQVWAILGFPQKPTLVDDGKTDFKVKKTEEGYEIRVGDKTGKGTFFFGPDLKLESLKAKLKDGPEVTLNTDYEKTNKGLRIRSCDWVYGKCGYKATATYENKDDYYVPKEIQVTFTDGSSKGVSIFDTLQFQHYDIDW